MKSHKILLLLYRLTATSILLSAILNAQQVEHQANVVVAPDEKKTAGFGAKNPGITFQLDVKPGGGYKFETNEPNDIFGQNRDSTLWQRHVNTPDLKTFKVVVNRIDDPHEAVFKLSFKKPEVASGGGGGTPPILPPPAYVKAVNCFVRIHTPGTIAAPGMLIPTPTVAGKPYTGILQPNTDDEINAGIEDHTSASKTGDGLTKDNDLVKVELSWNPTTLRQEMVEGKVLTLVLPRNTKAYLESGVQLTDLSVPIGDGSTGTQLAALGGGTRKQNIFIEGTSAWGGSGDEVTLFVSGLNYYGAEAKAKLVPADLAIHNGQAADTPIAEKDEENPGAFTVANLNDTDGDGTIDNIDNEVKRVTHGTNEEDLMKLTIKGPVQGRMKLTVVSGQVAFWEKSIKETSIPLQGNATYIECADLPKTIWVEPTNHSNNLRDIEIKLGWEPPDIQLCDNLDSVKATAVWAEKTDAKFANGDALWREADDPVKATFNNFLGGVFGPNMNPPIEEFNYVIGLEFTVKPNGIATMAGVVFDITRDKAFRDWYINGGVVTQNFIAGKDDVFDKGDISDDDHIIEPDEDVIPRTMPPSDKIFSIDGPGEKFVLNDQVISRNHFEEFVRVSFNSSRPRGENDDGSRCSSKVKWHAFYWMEKDPTKQYKKYRMRAGKDNVVGLLHPLSLGTTPSP